MAVAAVAGVGNGVKEKVQANGGLWPKDWEVKAEGFVYIGA